MTRHDILSVVVHKHDVALTNTMRRFAHELIDTAVKAERDRIVAWLREQEDIGFDRMLRADAPNSQRNYAAGAEAVKRCADLIKAGEHLT